jgi:putative spermidine/putrescine transport system substrate-binding protein
MCACEVVFETGNNADRLNKLKARGGKGVDVVFLTDSYSQLGIEEGVFQKVDRSKLPNVEKLYELAQAPQGDYGPAYTIGRAGIVYDSAEVEPITSWNDLWREDLEAQITLPGITTTAGPMVVVQAGKHAGVDAYEDPDAAFAAIEQLKPNTVKNYNTGSEMVNLVSTGEVSVAVAQDFTLASLKEAVPTMTWAQLEDGDIATLNTINIPTGAENVDLAHQFINFVLSTEIQQIEAEQGVDAPVNSEVELTAEQAALWTYGDEMISSLNRMDYEKMNAAKTQWIDRWNEIFGM